MLGDARLSLVHAPDKRYDLIVVDAFSSDAIPVHLLTKEALELYLAKLADHGLIAVHISNRYLDLEPVLGSLAGAKGLACVGQYEGELSDEEYERGKTASDWVVLTREAADLGPLAQNVRWHTVPSHSRERIWTDDFSNLLGVFKWK